MLLLSLVLAVAPPGEPKDTRVVLLLDDLSVVEAEPHKDGYAVRRGKELVPVPKERVRFVGDSKAAVHQHLLAQAATKGKPPAAVGYDALPLFASKVQPVLVNRCADCHARPEYPGRFKLARTPAGYADPEATERNARAAALAIDRAAPAASPMLAFAATPHGGAKAAPLERTHPAYRFLELWVRVNAPGPLPQPPAEPIRAVSGGRITPPPAAPVADPTDAGPFNRAVHPGR